MSRLSFSAELERRIVEPCATLVVTGAGISAESGLATFRGPSGLWEGCDPRELATPEAFRHDPARVWRFYLHRRQQADAAEPNAAHHALVAFEAARSDYLLVTQNVDGLHERAGSRRLERLHGSLWRARCDDRAHEVEDTRLCLEQLPPSCSCGAPQRPSVVWFGEPLPPAAWARAATMASRAQLVLVVGTSSTVYPCAELPAMARLAGAYVVEINTDTTPISAGVDERIVAPAAEALPRLLRAAGPAVQTRS